MYVNGVAVASSTGLHINFATLGAPTNPWIGKSEWSADPYLNAYLRDFRCYPMALR